MAELCKSQEWMDRNANPLANKISPYMYFNCELIQVIMFSFIFQMNTSKNVFESFLSIKILNILVLVTCNAPCLYFSTQYGTSFHTKQLFSMCPCDDWCLSNVKKTAVAAHIVNGPLGVRIRSTLRLHFRVKLKWW